MIEPTAEVLNGVRALMVSHVDNAGVSRVKVLPAHKIAGAGQKGSTVSLSVALLLAFDDAVMSTPELDSTVGDLRGIPDLSALSIIDPDSGLAWAPSDLHALDGTPHPGCPRSLLKGVVDRAGAADLDFSVGFELEFTLFRGERDDPRLAHPGPGYGVRPFLELEHWHRDLLDALATAGVPVEQIHPEYGAGQVELSFAPRDPVRAVDDYVLARIIISRVSLAHGFLPSFQPIADTASSGNGCHIHFSARRDGRNLFWSEGSRHGLDPAAESMVAGVLERLGESIALLGGTTLSFERLQPHHWAGAAICWGVGNREAAVRYMPGYAGFEESQSNIEVKCVDPAANHYLAVAALIAAALEGLESGAALPEPARTDPEGLTEEERVATRVHGFPASLDDALSALESSAFARSLLGDVALGAYVAVRRHEAKAHRGLPVEEVVRRTRWVL